MIRKVYTLSYLSTALDIFDLCLYKVECEFSFAKFLRGPISNNSILGWRKYYFNFSGEININCVLYYISLNTFIFRIIEF